METIVGNRFLRMVLKYIESHYNQVLNLGLNLGKGRFGGEGDIRDLAHDQSSQKETIGIAEEDRFHQIQILLHIETLHDATEGDNSVQRHVRGAVVVAVGIAGVIFINREGFPDPNLILDYR
jgi:hypothetical protein